MLIIADIDDRIKTMSACRTIGSLHSPYNAERERPGRMGKDPKELSNTVRAVDRALDVLLTAFAAGDSQLSAGELARRTGLSRPTMYRVIHTLQQRGFLVAQGEPQRFQLGPSVGLLAHLWNSGMDLTEVVDEGMQRGQEATSETVALYIRVGAERLCVAEMPSRHPLSFRRGVGYRERIVMGASGRAILAHLGTRAIQSAMEAGQLPFARQRFEQDLDLIRQHGWGVSRDELIDGAVAIAAPFFRAGGAVAGSLAVFGPAVRIDAARADQFGRILTIEAQQLSAALGWQGAPARTNVFIRISAPLDCFPRRHYFSWEL